MRRKATRSIRFANRNQLDPPVPLSTFVVTVRFVRCFAFSSRGPMGLALIVICYWSRVDQASRARFDSDGEPRLSRPQRNESQGKEHAFGFSAGGHQATLARTRGILLVLS